MRRVKRISRSRVVPSVPSPFDSSQRPSGTVRYTVDSEAERALLIPQYRDLAPHQLAALEEYLVSLTPHMYDLKKFELNLYLLTGVGLRSLGAHMAPVATMKQVRRRVVELQEEFPRANILEWRTFLP